MGNYVVVAWPPDAAGEAYVSRVVTPRKVTRDRLSVGVRSRSGWRVVSDVCAVVAI